MKRRNELSKGITKIAGTAKALIQNPKKEITRMGKEGLEQLKEKLMEEHNVHVEDDMKNPSTKTIDKSQVHRYGDSRDRIGNTLQRAWGSLPNTEKVNKNPPSFFGENLGGKTANKDSLISKLNQQFAKLGLRITQLFGGENKVQAITDIMESVFGMAESSIPDKYAETAKAAKDLVVGLMNHMAKSSNMVALIKVYRLTMIELFFRTYNYMYDHHPDKYKEMLELDKEWLDLWGISTGAFTDTDTVYKWMNNNDEHIKEFVAAITYAEVLQDVVFGDEINPIGEGKKWYAKYTLETLDAIKEAAEDGTISLSKKEQKKINKGKYPYLAEQV